MYIAGGWGGATAAGYLQCTQSQIYLVAPVSSSAKAAATMAAERVSLDIRPMLLSTPGWSPLRREDPQRVIARIVHQPSRHGHGSANRPFSR